MGAAAGLLAAGGAPAALAPVSPDGTVPMPAWAGGAASLTSIGPDGKTRVHFGLVHTRVRARITGNVARVDLVQLYQNPTADRLEAVYAFPLPPDAAVTGMVLQVGRRVVASEVRRREEARRTYEAARASGRTAALTEQERPNLFTQSVANVPPGETVAVSLRYVHAVELHAGRYLFHVPTTLGPRYVPGSPIGKQGPGWSPDTDVVADASRVTPPVVAPEVGSHADVDIQVALTPGEAFAGVASRSHRVVTGLDGAGARLVALAEDDRVPNKDFVLSWRAAGSAPAAHAVVEEGRGDRWLMLFLQPPAEVAPSQVRPKELVFLLDRSGSMYGRPLELAKRLVLRSLGALGPDDTFQIVAFAGQTEAMTAAPLAAGPESLARAATWLAQLGGEGGTEMLEGVRAALRASADPRRLRIVVFLTDGFIGNEAEIIGEVERLRGDARVFGFGVGSSVNRYLVEGVARAGRGAAEVVGLEEKPGEAVERLFRRLDRPVLTSLDIGFEGGAVADLLPSRLPDLFAGDPLVAVARIAGGAPPTAVTLRGRLGSEPWERRIEVVVTPGGTATSTSAPTWSADSPPLSVTGTLWARRRIDEILGRRPTAPAPSEVEEVVELALGFHLVTRYTSFVAVERELLVDPALPLAQVLVPNELPEGVSHERIFGPARVSVLPARVKPGDPELVVEAGPDAESVRVWLPFETGWRDAVRDGSAWVVRFLVPSGFPDGSWDAEVEIAHRGGERERRAVSFRVDTSAPPLAVVRASPARPGGLLSLSVKPALRLGRLADLAARPGGLVHAVKSEVELKEVLVRAPWGDVARARMEGPLGLWVADLAVPTGMPAGPARLEVAAIDAAGNVTRRTVEVPVELEPLAASSRPSTGGGLRRWLAALLFTPALAFAAFAWRRRPRPPHAAPRRHPVSR